VRVCVCVCIILGVGVRVCVCLCVCMCVYVCMCVCVCVAMNQTHTLPNKHTFLACVSSQTRVCECVEVRADVCALRSSEVPHRHPSMTVRFSQER